MPVGLFERKETPALSPDTAECIWLLCLQAVLGCDGVRLRKPAQGAPSRHWVGGTNMQQSSKNILVHSAKLRQPELPHARVGWHHCLLQAILP